ncbi:MAG: extracellular solute-binding protein [Anaerolineales bacterium]
MANSKLSRRHFLAGAASLGAGVVLAACAPKATPAPAAEQPAEEPAGQAAEQPAAEPAAQEAVTIRFNARTGIQGDHFSERARAFEQEYPNIKIKEEYFPDTEYHQKLEVMFAGGTAADTFWTILLSGLYARYSIHGLVMPIDDLIAADNYDLSVFYPTVADAIKVQGASYGLPWVCHPGRIGSFYNKTLYEEAGIELPPADGEWNLDDLLPQAKELTRDTDGDGKIDQFGFMPNTETWGIQVWLRSFGSDLFSEDGTKCIMDSEEGMEAFQFLYDLYHVHKVAPTPEQVIDMMFETGRVANYISGYWGISAKARVGDRFEMGCAPMPKGPAGVMGSMFEFDPICIYSKCQHPTEAFEWLNWLANQETGIRIAEVGSVPGARPDVWESPRLTKEPMHVVWANMMANCMPFRGPGNFRGNEIDDAVKQGLGALWENKGTPKEIVPQVAKSVQEILDLSAD